MSLEKFESEVRPLRVSQTQAYYMLSDLNHLAVLRAKLTDPLAQEKMAEQVPADKLEQLRTYLDQTEFTADTVSVASPIGNVTLRVSEREEPKLIKLVSEGSPLPLTLWIQIVPSEPLGSRLRVTVGAEVNFFMKGMVAKPMQKAADGLAVAFAAVAEMTL